MRDSAFLGAVTTGVFVAAALAPERLGTVLLVGSITAGLVAERDRTTVLAATVRDRSTVRPTVGSHS